MLLQAAGPELDRKEGTMISFFVPGIPKAQPRPRATMRGAHAAVYDPGTAQGWKATIHRCALGHKPAATLTGPIRVDLDFGFPRPQRLMRKKDPDGQIRHTVKPDRDNLEKAVLDALTGCGFWVDDCQVCDGTVRKWYVPKGGPPGVLIAIEEIDERGVE